MKRRLPELATPPPERLRLGLDVLRWYFAPEYLHLERVSARRPTLFVGNHSVYGVLDVLLFADGLYRERGVVLRSLADRNHFKVPVWRDFVEQTGAVLGTRANCAALMRGGEEFPPLVRGLGLTPLPRPEKLHFSVGSPIDMARYRGREQDPEVLRSARTRVARSLERLIAELGPHRARSRGQGALRRVLNRL